MSIDPLPDVLQENRRLFGTSTFDRKKDVTVWIVIRSTL